MHAQFKDTHGFWNKPCHLLCNRNIVFTINKGIFAVICK